MPHLKFDPPQTIRKDAKLNIKVRLRSYGQYKYHYHVDLVYLFDERLSKPTFMLLVILAN